MSKEENLNKDIDLKNYDDPSGISLREMNFGLWLAENRQKFLKILTVFLILLSAFFFIYSTYNFIIYFISEDPNIQLVSGDIPTSPRNITANLEISPLQIFDSGERYDLAVKLKNPNDKFVATFKYCFIQAEKKISCGEDFILPAGEKYLLALGQELNGSQSETTFKIIDNFWLRVNAHQIPDWANFSSSRLNFAVSDLNFVSAGSNNLSEKINLNSLVFLFKNQTPYSYYEAPLNILLFSGSNLVGVNRYLVQNFLAGETRNIKISWSGNLTSVDRTEVAPDINIMDENIYLKYQGGNSN